MAWKIAGKGKRREEINSSRRFCRGEGFGVGLVWALAISVHEVSVVILSRQIGSYPVQSQLVHLHTSQTVPFVLPESHCTYYIWQ